VRRENPYVVIVGCGKLGAFLAEAFSEDGCSVVVIDREGSRFAELSSAFSGFTIEGSAVELPTLEQAKTDQADVFVAATGSESVNLMTSQIARVRYKVPKIASRIYSQQLEEFCRGKGIIPIPAVSVEAASFLKILGRRGHVT
jgi:trk system potassium uptake protein TrkA